MVLPPDSGSNRDFALAYHRLGWWVFPGRDDLDLAQYRHALIAQGMSPADAATKAERTRKNTFVAWRDRVAQGPAGRPTEAEIRDWFADDRPRRPVCVLTGPGCTEGGQLVGVDIDPASGGDPAPWIGEGVTMLARTPRGGWHAYHLASDAEPVKSSAGKVAPGVDIRAAGGLLVAPSGNEATPGRSWERWGVLSPAPLAEIHRRLGGRSPARVRQPDGEVDPNVIPEPPELRPFSAACLEPATDGTRNSKAATLIGVLARPGPLPHDTRTAAVALLRDWCERRDLADDIGAMLESGWESHLEADKRPAAFAVEVLRAWNSTRCSPPWSDDKVSDTARSLWRSATARQSARPDVVFHVAGGELAEVRRGPGPVNRSEGTGEAPRGGVFEPPSTSGTVDGYITERGEIVDRATGQKVHDDNGELIRLTRAEAAGYILPTLRSRYGRKEFLEKLRTPVLSCATLPPWQTITAGGIVEATDTPHGHGLGEEIDVALAGGLRPGYFAVVGAKTAKAGKTALADQIIDGLLLRSLDVLARLKRGEATRDLIVVRYDLSEMSEGDMTDRQLGRWIGIDSTIFRRGDQAHLTPGVRRLAPNLHLTREQVVDMVHNAAGAALEDGRLADLRDLRSTIDLESLPGRSDSAGKGKDYQAGPLLLRRVAAAITEDRARRAEEWGVPEEQICPLLFVDPIQRFQGGGSGGEGGAVEALDGFAKALKMTAASLKAIVVATSDTNKDSATGAAKRNAGAGKADTTDTRSQGEQVAATLRGSYGLTHAPDLTLVLARDDDEEELKPGKPIKVRLVTGANRWLARAISIPLWFDPETGRYTPRLEEEPCFDIPAPPPPRSLFDEQVAALQEHGLAPTEARTICLGLEHNTIEEIADVLLKADGGPSTPRAVKGYLKTAADKWGISGSEATRLGALVERAREYLGVTL